MGGVPGHNTRKDGNGRPLWTDTGTIAGGRMTKIDLGLAGASRERPFLAHPLTCWRATTQKACPSNPSRQALGQDTGKIRRHAGGSNEAAP